MDGYEKAQLLRKAFNDARKFKAHFKGVSGHETARIIGEVTVGIDYRGCTKESLAETYATNGHCLKDRIEKLGGLEEVPTSIDEVYKIKRDPKRKWL